MNKCHVMLIRSLLYVCMYLYISSIQLLKDLLKMLKQEVQVKESGSQMMKGQEVVVGDLMVVQLLNSLHLHQHLLVLCYMILEVWCDLMYTYLYTQIHCISYLHVLYCHLFNCTMPTHGVTCLRYHIS